MLKFTRNCWLVFGLHVCLIPVCFGASEPNARALRYYKLLSVKPSSEYVYDRFYDAWLDTGTLPELQDFLSARLQEAPTVGHHLLLSFFYERQGDDAQALQLYEQALAREPANADLYFRKAKTEVRLSNLTAAIADLHKLEELDMSQSSRIKAGKLLAKLYVRTLEAEKARQTWQGLLEKYPEDEDLYEELIELQLTEGLYDDALKTSDALLARTTDNYQRVMRQLRRGDIYQYQMKKQEALEIYSSTLAWVEQASWLENQICAQIEQVFRREDDMVGLKAYWDKLAETYPQRISLTKRRAAALLQVGESEEALALYREILRVTPGDKANQQAYIEALVKAGQLERAIELLGQLRQRNPTDNELLIRLASLHYQNNDPNATGQVLEEYLQHSEKSEYIYLRVARLLERYQLKDRALAVYQASVDANPESHTAQEAHADALYRCGQADRALEIWQQLAQVNDLSLLLRVTQSAAIRGHQAQALAWLEGRYEAYGTDISYVNRLCNLALQCKAYDRAVQWTQDQLKLAQRFSQVESAIQHILTLCQDADSFGDWTERLENLSAPSPQERCLQAALLVKFDEFDRAHQVLDAVQGPGRNLALQQKIRLYRQQRRWEDAAQHTQALIKLTGTREAAYVRDLVELYERAGLLDRALQWIPAWKKVAPGSASVWLTQAGLLEKQANYSEAINCLRRADASFDGDTAILQKLAGLYRANERQAEAQRVYWRLYEHAGDVTDKLRWARELATTALALQQQDALIDTFQQRQRNNRSSVVPCLALAEVYRHTGQYEERRQALLEATRLRPQDIGLLHEIARIEESEGDWQRALHTLEQAASLDRTDKTRQKMARLHIQYGNEQDGYRILFDLAHAERIKPRDAESLVNSMIATQDWAMALEFLEGLLPQYPEDYRLHYLYGLALEEEGHEDRAVQQFLGLMDMKKELPAVKSATTPFQQYQQYQTYFTIIPEQVREWMMIQNMYSQAYPQRRGRFGSARYYYGYGGRQPSVPVPSSVDMCRRYALIHLIVLADTQPGTKREHIRRQLSSRGVAHAEILLHLPPQDGQQYAQDLSALADQFPRHKTVLGLLAFYGMSGHVGLPEQLRTAYALLSPEYPLFAALIGLVHGAQEADSDAMLNASLATLCDTEKVDAYAFNVVTQTLARPNTRLTEQHKAQLKAKLHDWYAGFDQNATYKRHLLQSWLRTLIADDNKREFVRVLDQEVQRARQAPAQSPHSRSWQQRSHESIVQPLPKVPADMLNLPEHVHELLVQDRGHYGPRQATFEPNDLKAYLQDIGDPVLRNLLRVIAEEDQEAERDLQQHLQTQTDDQAARILLASIWARQDRESDAVALLHQVTRTPWAKSRRSALDGAIVCYGMDLDKNKHAQALDQARQAALRLCGQPLNQSQQENLVRALSALDLSDQADKLVLRASSLQQARQQRQQLGMLRNPYSTPRITQIEGFLEKGKTDTALRLALRSLETNLGRSRFPSALRQDREVTDLLVRLQAYKLAERLLEMAHPGQSQNLKRRLFYAQLCQLLDRPEQALAIYQGILQRRPRDPVVHLRLASLLSKDDPNEALTHLRSIRRRDEGLVGEFLLALCDERPENPEQVETLLSTGALARGYLQQLEDPNRSDLHWVDRMRQKLTDSMDFGSVDLPSIYRSDDASDELNEQHLQLQAKRRRVHNNLCQAMLPVPQLASQGFTGLHAEARARQALTDAHLELAYQAWRVVQGQLLRGVYTSSQRWGEGRAQRTVDPLEYLIYETWKQGTLPDCVRRLQEAVPAERSESVAQQIDAIAGLYLVPAAEFAQAADAFVNQWMYTGPSLMSFPVRSIDSRLAWVMDAYADRKLNADLDALILKCARAERSGYGYDLGRIVRVYVSARASQHGEQARQFLERLVTVLLGPRDRRQDLIDRHYQPHRMSRNTINGRIHMCVDMMRRLAEDQGLFWTVLGQMDGLAIPETRLRYTVENTLQQHLRKDPNELSAFLAASPFLGDIADFTPLPIHDLEDGSVYIRLIKGLDQGAYRGRGRPDASRTVKLAAALDAYGPSFGVDFLRAHLAEDRHQAVFTCLGKHWQAFQTLDPTRKQRISQVLTYSLAQQSPGPVELVGSAAEAQAWFVSTRAASVDDQVTAFLQVKRMDELKVESHRFDDYVGNLLNKAILQDPNVAKAVLLKAQDLVNKPQLGRNRYYAGRSIITDVLDRRRYRSENPLADIGLTIALIQDANDQNIVLSPNTFRNYHRLLDTTYRRNRPSSRPSPLDMLKTVYKDVGPLVGRKDASILLNLVAYMCERQSWQDTDMQMALDWSQMQVQDGPWPGLARIMSVQLVLYQNTRMGRSRQDGDGPKALPQTVLTHYQGMLADETLSLQWRIMSLNMLLNRIGGFSAEDLALSGTELLIRAWNKYPSLPSETYASLLRAFVGTQDHPNWTPQAQAVTRAYVDYQQKTQRSGGRSYASSVDLPVLELNCMLNQDQRIRQQITVNNSRLGQQLDSWAVLLEHGKTKILASLVQQHWKQMYPRGSRVFPQAPETQLAQALASIERDDLRYFAQAALNCLPDPYGGARRHSEDFKKSRGQRLARLAQGFAAVTFQSQQLEQRTLYCLIQEYTSLPYLEKALAQQAKNIDLKLLINMRDRLFKQTQSELLAAHAINGIRQGDPNDFVQMAQSLNTLAAGAQRHEVDELREILRRRLTDLGPHMAETWSKSQMAALAAASTELMLSNSDRLRYAARELLPAHLVFHVLGEQEEKLDAVYEQMPDAIRERMVRDVDSGQMHYHLSQYLRQRNLALAQKIDIVKRFHQIDVVKQAVQKEQQRGRDIMDILGNDRIFTRAEVQSRPELVKELAGEDKNIAAFLAAKSWEDLALEGTSLDRHALELLNAPRAQDVTTALNLLVQAETFSQAAQQAGAWQGKTNEPALSYLLSRKHVENLVDVGIAVSLARDRKDSTWILPARYCGEVSNILFNLYGEMRGPNKDPLPALEQLLQRLGPYFQQKNATGMAACWTDLLGKHLREDDDALARVLAWAQDRTDAPDYGVVAQEIVLASHLRQLTRAHGDRHNPNTKIKLPADHPITRHYQTFLGDDSVSVGWRLLALENLQWWKIVLEPPLLTPACELMLQGLHQYEAVPVTLYTWIVQQFRALDQHDAAWQQRAEALSQAYLEHAYPYPRIELSWCNRRASAARLSTAMLQLHLQAEMDQALQKQIAQDRNLPRYPGNWSLLVKYQQADLFRSFAQDHIHEVKTSTSAQRFTKRIERNLETCLQTVTPAENRYAAELLIAAQYDTRSDELKARVPRAQRLNDLAQRFSSVDFSRTDLKHKALFWLSRECSALDPLSSALAQALEPLELAELLQLKPEESHLRLSLVAAHHADRLIKADPEGFVQGFTACLAEGDPGQAMAGAGGSPGAGDPAAQLLIQKMGNKVSDPRQAEAMRRSIQAKRARGPQRISASARVYWEALNRQLGWVASYLASQWSPAQMEALAQATAAYLNQTDMQRGVPFQPDRLTLHAASSLCAGRSAERINSEARAFPGDVQRFYQRHVSDPDALHTLCKELVRFVEGNDLSVDKRVALVNALLQLDQIQKAAEKSGGRQALLAEVQKHEILTAEESAQHAQALGTE